jgi:hypothetical protein
VGDMDSIRLLLNIDPSKKTKIDDVTDITEVSERSEYSASTINSDKSTTDQISQTFKVGSLQ